MNPRQMGLQIRHLLRLATWPAGDTESVFGTGSASSVVLTAGIPDPTNTDLPGRAPFALIGVVGGRPDADDPNLIEQTYRLVLGCDVKGDKLGTGALVGHGRTGGLGSSRGRGILEVQTVALDAVSALTGADGASVVVSASTHADVERIAEASYYALRGYDLAAWVTEQAEYTAPWHFVATGTALTWANPSNRHDYIETMVRRKAGASPPTDETDGDLVTTTTGVAFTDTGFGSGYSYAAFAGYSDQEGTTSDSYSALCRGCYATVE